MGFCCGSTPDNNQLENPNNSGPTSQVISTPDRSITGVKEQEDKAKAKAEEEEAQAKKIAGEEAYKKAAQEEAQAKIVEPPAIYEYYKRLAEQKKDTPAKKIKIETAGNPQETSMSTELLKEKPPKQLSMVEQLEAAQKKMKKPKDRKTEPEPAVVKAPVSN